MSTRSYIACATDDGFEGAYCHWDGYPQHNGAILLEHYREPDKLAQLLALGDMSTLGESVGSEHDFNNRPEGSTTYYGRDRGETGVHTQARKFRQLAEVMRCAEDYGCEFLYVYEDQLWQYAERGSQYFGMSDGSKLSQLQPLWTAFTTAEKEE